MTERSATARQGVRFRILRRDARTVRLLLEDAQGRPTTCADLLKGDIDQLICALRRTVSETKQLTEESRALAASGKDASKNYRFYNRTIERN